MFILCNKFTVSLCQNAIKSRKMFNCEKKLIHASSSSILSQKSESSQNIFDRNVKRLHKERSARSPDVELYDYIKDEVGFRLSDRIFDIKREFKNAADIGLMNLLSSK